MEQHAHIIRIVDDALAIVNKEAVYWKERRIEAGGSLVGVQNHNVSTILYAIPTGEKAKQSGASIETDDAYQNDCIKRIQSCYPDAGLEYLVDYHTHTMFLPRLSGTDRATCEQILTARPSLVGLPLILVTFRGDELLHVPLWITRDRELKIEQAEMETIPPEATRPFLNNEAYLPFEEMVSASVDPYEETESLEQRLKEEAMEIGRRFVSKATIKEMKTGYLCICSRIRSKFVLVVIPPEYPLNPPTVLIKGKRSFREYYYNKPWNSLCRIADILGDIARKGVMR